MYNPRRSEYLSTSFGRDYRDYDIPPDVQLEACIKGAELQLEQEGGCGYRAASISIQIQIMDALFIFSRGPDSVGRVTVASSPDQPPGVANIKVTAKHKPEGVLDPARVLLLCRNERSKGVGIFTPRSYIGPSTAIEFEVTIILPEGTEDQPFNILKFHGDTPGMRYRFDNLHKISFEEVQISCKNGSIEIDFLRAEKGTIATNNGSIRGQLESTGEILCRTANGSIRVEATLISGIRAAALTAITGNGDVRAGIYASSSTCNPVAFAVWAQTTNGPVHVDFKEAPEFSTIELKAITRNGPATVHLPATFDGEFVATTTPDSQARAVLTAQAAEGEYPTVKGREIHLEMANSLRGDRVTGRVGCTEDRKAGSTGNVHVEAGQSSATINLR